MSDTAGDLKVLKRFHAELQAAAIKVVEEADRIHDTDPWPIKYRAPYDAITKLRLVLSRQMGIRSPRP